MKTKKFRLMVVLVLMLSMVLPMTVQAKSSDTVDNGQFVVKPSYGIEGTIKYGCALPMNIEVTNNGKDFAGTVRVIGIGDYSGNIAYEKEVSIAASTSKTVSFSIGQGTELSAFCVQIEDEKGNVKYSKIIGQNSFTGTDKAIVGILSDSFTALNYFDGASLYRTYFSGTSKIIELNPNNIPEDAMSLDICDFIVIDNYDTSKLNENQILAIKKWVGDGGILIFGTGSEYAKVFASFNDDFVSGNIGNLSKKEITVYESSYSQGEIYNETSGYGYDNYPDDQTGNDVQNIDDVDNNPSDTSEAETTEEATTEASEDDGTTTEAPVDDGTNDKDDKANDLKNQDKEIDNTQNDVQPDDTATEGTQSNYSSGMGETVNVDVLDIQVNDAETVGNIIYGADIYQKSVGKGSVVVVPFCLGLEPIASMNSRGILASALLSYTGNEYNDEIMNGVSTGDLSTMNYDTKSALNSIAANKVPNVVVYAFIFFIYVICVGPVMYLILKAMNKREAMWVAIPILSFGFTIIVLISSMFYRINKPFACEYVFMDYGDGSINSTIYSSIQSPKSKKYDITFTEGIDSIVPYSDDDYSYSEDINIDYDSAIRQDNDGMSLVLSKTQAFTKTNYILQKTEANNGQGLNVDLTFNGSTFEGTVTNNTPYDLSDVVVYYNSQYVLVDKLKSGETKNLAKTQILNSSYGGGLGYSIFGYDDMVMFDSEESKEVNRNRSVYLDICDRYIVNAQYYEGIAFGHVDNFEYDAIATKNVKEYTYGVVATKFQHYLYSGTGNFYEDIVATNVVGSTGDYDTYDGWMYAEQVDLNFVFNPDDNIENLSMIDRTADTYQQCADVYAFNWDTQQYDRIFVNEETVSGEDMKHYYQNQRISLRFINSNKDATGIIPSIAAYGEE